MIYYHFILVQDGRKFKIWSKTLFQYLKWVKRPGISIDNLYLSTIKLDDDKLSTGYYHEEIE